MDIESEPVWDELQLEPELEPEPEAEAPAKAGSKRGRPKLSLINI